MDARIVDREAFKVMGVIGHYKSAEEDFTKLQDKDFESFHNIIKAQSIDKGYYGVFQDSIEKKPIDYLAGMAVGDISEIPEGLKTCEVPAAKYAVFNCTLKTIGPAYQYILSEWFPRSVFNQDSSKLSFQYYHLPVLPDGDMKMEIWFPIRRKEDD